MNPLFVRSPVLALVAILAIGCGTSREVSDASYTAEPLEYAVDLNDRSGDPFKVTLRVDDVGPENAVYQFASTAPGTYQVLDIGRFVRTFEAVDAAGGVIDTELISS